MHKTTTIDYQDAETALQGYVVYPEKIAGQLPVVLVCHDWSGKNDFAHHRAQHLAELGYIGFAIDLYGTGKVGSTNAEKSALMQPLMQNRAKLQQRLHAALHIAQTLPSADPHNIAAIGFCFGGLCALDLARSGADIKGVVSFHGLLGAPQGLPHHPIKAKILVLHGYDDPMATPADVVTFADEMTTAKVDWQINMYSNTKHAFTNPNANDPANGLIYKKETAERAFTAMREFLKEVL